MTKIFNEFSQTSSNIKVTFKIGHNHHIPEPSYLYNKLALLETLHSMPFNKPKQYHSSVMILLIPVN